MAGSAAVLIERLGLSDEEALVVLDADPLRLIAGDMTLGPQLEILLTLTAAAAERVGEELLRRWLRVAGPAGRPIALLTARDFAGFEDALAGLEARGLVLRSRAPEPG